MRAQGIIAARALPLQRCRSLRSPLGPHQILQIVAEHEGTARQIPGRGGCAGWCQPAPDRPGKASLQPGTAYRGPVYIRNRLRPRLIPAIRSTSAKMPQVTVTYPFPLSRADNSLHTQPRKATCTKKRYISTALPERANDATRPSAIVASSASAAPLKTAISPGLVISNCVVRNRAVTNAIICPESARHSAQLPSYL